MYDHSASVPRYVYIDYIDAYGASTTRTLTNKTLTSPIVTGLHLNDSGFTVEGSSADANETTVTFTNPTADRTITFPNATGTVALTSDIPSTALDDIQAGDGAVTLSTTSGDITIDAEGSNTDIIFMGTDGVSHITALTLDMSAAGTAIFNSGVQTGLYFWAKTDDAVVFYAGANTEIQLTHVHNTGFLLTNIGTGTPTVELQFVDSNESISSDGTNLFLKSGGNAITVPNSGADTMTLNAATQTLTNKTLTSPKINEDVAVTATATELNKLDGVTATATELNYVDVTTLGLTEASKAVTADANGVVSFDNGTIEEVTSVSSSSNAATINLRDGNVFEHDLTENVTYTFSNPAANGRGSAFILKVIQDSSARSITWPGSVDWAGGTAPTLTTTNNGVDVFGFLTIDGGTTYYGFTLGQAMG